MSFPLLIPYWSRLFFIYIYNFIYLFIFGYAGSSLLLGLFSIWGEWRLLSSYCVWLEYSLVGVLSLQWLPLLQSKGSRHTGFGSCSLQALEHRLSSYSAWAYLLQGMWTLPWTGIKPMSPAMAGRFFTTEPPGKTISLLLQIFYDIFSTGLSKLTCPVQVPHFN